MRSAIGLTFGLLLVACGSTTANTHQTETNNSCDHESCSIDIANQPLNPAMLLIDNISNNENKRCVDGMIFVSGEYCPIVQETCLYFVDAHGNRIPETKRWPGRCGEYKAPTKCLSAKKVHKEFCIDQYEYPNIKNHIPQSWMSWYDVKASCEKEGKRLCTKSEWTMSCEGPEMHPYPYGDGFHRDTTACNFDHATKGIDVFSCTPHKDSVSGRMVSPAVDAPCRKQLDGLLVPSGSMTRCVSAWGVFDQVGNIDEFVVNETHYPYNSGLVGGHVFGVRNACRAMTEAHNESFAWYETSGRCCKDSN